MAESLEDLRKQLDAQREARRDALERLKIASQRATKGRPTPITDSYKLPAKEELTDSGEEDETPTQKLARTQLKVDASHEARRNGLMRLKQTTMQATQFVRETTFMDAVHLRRHLDDEDEEPNNGSSDMRPAAAL